MTGSAIARTTALWRWSGGANGGDWYFVSIDGEGRDALSAHALMDRLERGRKRGFGSVKVRVTVGDSSWLTSAFPMKQAGWSIPIKAAMRRAENLAEGQFLEITIEPL